MARKSSLAPRYHLVDDFLTTRPQTDADREAAYDLAHAPAWALCVFPLALPASADRSKLTAKEQPPSVSTSDTAVSGVRLRSDPLIITDDAVQGQVSSQKGQYASHLSVTLCASPVNYLAALLPGDWVMCWAGTRDRIRDVVARLRELRPCNLFLDGLRFVGRVDEVVRDRSADPRTGLNSVSYQLQAVGFGELGAQLFYDPYLAEAVPLMGSWLARIGGSVNELLGDDSSGLRKGGRAGSAALDVNKLIPFFLNLLLGDGVDRRYANPGSDPALQIATGLTRRDSGEAPYAYTVPGEVGRVLGKRPRSRGSVLAYADVLELVAGVQRFEQAAGSSASSSSPWSVLTPDGLEPPPATDSDFPDALQRKSTGIDMLGEFMPTIPDFANKDVWSVLRQFLNPTVNEMYTALRTNEVGQVVPTLVVRQIPLSSELAAERLQAESNVQCTPFLEVPRWVGHPAIVRSDQLGRSDATRFNFVHVYGQSPTSQKANTYTEQVVRSPPVRNDLDIQRSGLRPYMATVNCSIDESVLGPRRWMALAADWLLDQHLSLRGQVELELVPAPVAVGDNFEYDGVVSHIEAVVHRFGVDLNGTTWASTHLSLSHGMRSDNDPNYDKEGAAIFPALLAADQRGEDPGVAALGERPSPTYGQQPTSGSLGLASDMGAGSFDPLDLIP